MANPYENRPIRSQDYGFFGPDSPSWKVWAAPTALIGFQRSVVLEHFDPFLTAAVADMAGIYREPRVRLDHTLAYFLTVAVGDGRTAVSVADHLMTVHAKATGVEPITGRRYSANNPESQLWIHVTGWHSVLKCYEVFGPGPLSPAEESRYWAECAVAAELQTCKPADVPRSRAEVRAYFAEVRPRLCSSERAHEAMHYLLRTSRKNAGTQFWALSRALAPATIATLPGWMRRTGGFDQPAIVDAAVRPAMRVAMRATRSPRAMAMILGSRLPATAHVLRQHYQADAPLWRETVTPTQARASLAAELAPGVLAEQPSPAGR